MRTISIVLLLLCGSVPTLFAKDKNPFMEFDTKDSTTRSSGTIYPMHPKGAVGLFHTYSALKQDPSPKTFGVGFMGNYYLLKEFPVAGAITERFEGGFFVNYTPIEYLELFGAVGVVSTNNEPPANPLLRQIPNFDFGAKLTLPVMSQLYAGLVYHGEFRNNVSNITNSTSALNHEILAVATYDMTSSIPVRVHLNAGYRVDNNVRVAQTGADARVTNVTRAYSDNAILVSLGAEYVLDWASFSLEYSLDSISGQGFSGSPQRVSLGGRFYPTKDRDFGFTVGSDIGTSSADATTAGVYKEANYSFYLGINYLFGSSSPKEEGFSTSSDQVFDSPKKQSNQTSTKSGRTGTIIGYVTDIETGSPVEGARIQTCKEGVILMTTASGSFQSPELPEGPCAITVEHPSFKAYQDQVNVTAGVNSPFDFGLLQSQSVQGAVATPAPVQQAPAQTGVRIVARDQNGEPIAAQIYFANDMSRVPLMLPDTGQNTFQLAPGPYELFAKYKNQESYTRYILLKEGEEMYVEFTFSGEPKKVTISKDKKSIEISEKIQFEIGKAMLTFNSQKIVEEIASVMLRHKEIELVEIAGHTDNVGDATYNLKLSQERADAVKAELTKLGIDEARLRSVGYGEDFPIADNETEEGKYQNRRVEFRILKRKD
ncbi:MAG: OmpA family protein [Bdellovibrionales bacterium]|nr:OmpA family protein [Bdellovibrionales bacterium]